MSGFFWNIRGLNQTTKHSIISRWINSGRLQFGSFLETRVKEQKSSRIISSVFKDWSVMCNYEHHHLGRLWVLWKPKVRLTPIFKSSQIISCSVLLEGEQEEFFCTFVYASNFIEERRELILDFVVTF